MPHSELTPPEFGRTLGVWYPLAWRVLELRRWWPSARFLPGGSALATDVYVGVWWFFELGAVGTLSCLLHWRGWLAWLLLALVGFRFFDIAAVLLALLVRGSYDRQLGVASVSRVLLMTLLNALEVMFLFGIAYRFLGVALPSQFSLAPSLTSFGDAVYFSVTTATTVGYGSPAPSAPGSKALAMIEACTTVLLIFVMISSAAGGRSLLSDSGEKKA